MGGLTRGAKQMWESKTNVYLMGWNMAIYCELISVLSLGPVIDGAFSLCGPNLPLHFHYGWRSGGRWRPGRWMWACQLFACPLSLTLIITLWTEISPHHSLPMKHVSLAWKTGLLSVYTDPQHWIENGFFLFRRQTIICAVSAQCHFPPPHMGGHPEQVTFKPHWPTAISKPSPWRKTCFVLIGCLGLWYSGFIEARLSCNWWVWR